MTIAHIPVTNEATFFSRRRQGDYVVIHEGLPFTVPDGDISMVIRRAEESPSFVDHLVTGTIYELGL